MILKSKNEKTDMMKKIISLLLLIVFSFAVVAQNETREDKKAERAKARIEKKKAEKEKAEWMEKITRQMVESRKFVLEADYLAGTYGDMIPVSPDINFIAIDSNRATIQLGIINAPGYNGVGGITVEGKVTKYEYQKIEKKKFTAYNVTVIVFSNAGTYDIQFFIGDDGRGDATIRGTRSGKLDYKGIFYPPDISRVYMGTPEY